MKFLFALLLIATSLINAQSNHVAIAFTHVAVIDTTRASIQQDMTVVIVGDHIADVGRAAAIKVPSNARVIDGHNKFLMPGLWDMHVHTFNHNPRSTNTC